MIRYALKCAQAHKFESWFHSAEAYEKLAAAGHVSCAICGIADVQKDIMAPRVTTASKHRDAPPGDAAPMPSSAMPSQAMPPQPMPGPPSSHAPGPLSAPASPAEQALAALRKHVEANSTDVGDSFADKARAMHEGDLPEAPIHGTAQLDEAKKLIDEGVPIAPLPFRPNSKNN